MNEQNQTTALARPVGSVNTLKTLLAEIKESMAAVIPRHLTPDRMLKIALIATSRNPVLLECTRESILKSMMTASELGLEPDGIHAALVPYRNKSVLEAQLQPMYRGLLRLARNSGELSSLEAHVVYEADVKSGRFEVEYGLEPKLVHKPDLFNANPGPPVAVYAVATLKDGTKQVEVMTAAQVEHIRQKSKAKDSGPWVTDPEEMWRKTVIKRLCKYIPASSELVQAVAHDDLIETGGISVLDDAVIQAAAARIPETPKPKLPEKTADDGRRLELAMLAGELGWTQADHFEYCHFAFGRTDMADPKQALTLEEIAAYRRDLEAQKSGAVTKEQIFENAERKAAARSGKTQPPPEPSKRGPGRPRKAPTPAEPTEPPSPAYFEEALPFQNEEEEAYL